MKSMKNVVMTEGKIMPILFKFAIPLMLGDLFQQLYIAVDSAIVGKSAGNIALAAVGSSTFLIRLIVGLFVGISAGSSVVIAQCIGAKNYQKVQTAIHTMAALTLVGGIVLTLIGVFITPWLLKWVSTPEEVMPDAIAYLKIYFAGSLFNLIYNVGSGILRAFGDTKRPLLYLMSSSVINLLLDVLFIVNLGWGAGGAAFATIIAQFVSAVLVISSMLISNDYYKLVLKKIHITKSLVPEILQMGLPAGIQSAIVALSNVLVQTNINAVGAAAMAGFGVFNKVDGVIMLPVSALSAAAMTFVGQNFGAGKSLRVIKGIKDIILLEMLSWVIGLTICLLFGRQICTLFTNDEEIIRYTLMVMKYLVPCYFAMGIGIALTSSIRGMGKSKEASLMFMLTMCGVRQLFINISKMFIDPLTSVLLSYPISWLATVAVTLSYLIYLKKKTLLMEA